MSGVRFLEEDNLYKAEEIFAKKSLTSVKNPYLVDRIEVRRCTKNHKDVQDYIKRQEESDL
ncbi:MAG: hypothetical protein JST75_09290 [Bacteroidetes bacterium]|nr:hypothetical protein [Bacteroidota bacterium]